MFTFVLIDHHRHLGAVPAEPERNPVEALRQFFDRATKAGELPRRGSPDFAVAVSLGIVVQTATFVHYGRLRRPLSSHVRGDDARHSFRAWGRRCRRRQMKPAGFDGIVSCAVSGGVGLRRNSRH